MGLWDGVLTTAAAPSSPSEGDIKAPANMSKFWDPVAPLPSSAPLPSTSPTFSFNPILNPAPAVETAQPGFFSRMGTAVKNFFTSTPASNPTPLSLYDQVANQEVFGAKPDTSLYGTPSTPQTTTEANPLLSTLQAVPQFLGSYGLSIGDIFTNNNEGSKIDPSSPALKLIFGDQPVYDVGTRLIDAANAVKNSPFAQQMGLDKGIYPNVLAIAGVTGGDSLNFLGAGGEEAALKALAVTTDIGETTKILRTIGVQDDLLPHVAPKIAAMQDTAQIQDALNMVDHLQKTTKLTGKVSEFSKMDDLRGTLEQNLIDAPTPAKRAAIQSQIDAIDKNLAAMDNGGNGKTSASEAGKAVEQGADREISQSVQSAKSRRDDALKGPVTPWTQAGFATKKEYDAALKDIAEYGESEKSGSVRRIIAGKITMKPYAAAKDMAEWKEMLGDRYYKIFKKSAGSTPDDMAAQLGYEGEEELKNDIADEVYRRFNETPTRAPRARKAKMTTLTESLNAPESELQKGSTVGEGTQASAAAVDAFAGYGKTINDRVPLPKSVGEILSNRQIEAPVRANPSELPQTGPHAPQSQESRMSDRIPSEQSTTQKVDLSILGKQTEERVRNAIGRSQAIGTQITNKGQEAYLSGRGLSNADLATIRDGYQAGKPLEEIAKKTGNPTRAMDLMGKISNYYDFELAADRAAGGDTARVDRYLPQYWDLSNPFDASRWDELAKQKGLKPYYGFRSQSKIFKTYAEGIAAGFTPARSNILEDLKANYESASTAIGRQALKRGLKEAAPDMVGMSGYGMTPEGKPFVNSNIPGLEGLSYHPAIDRQLQGFQPLRSKDFIDLVKKSGAEAALEHVGIMGSIDKMVAMAKSVPANAKEAGFTGVLGSIYDNVSGPMKQVLWNWSGFHSINITLSHMGASALHPIIGGKGVLQSVGSAVSERLYKATVDSYKNLMVAKDAKGLEQSVYDWAVESGALESRGLPAFGMEHFHPFKGGHRLIFDREIPVLQMNLAEQAARKGIVAASPEGLALGKEIRAITGEINAKTMNINPNTLKAASRAFLAPGFTFSKYKTMLDAFTSWGAENGAAGNMARTAVIGKSAIIGVAATLGTLLATGQFPNLQQLLMNFSFNPSIQTNLTNPKGRKLDITFPKTFLAEGASAVLDPVAYGNARLNPLISDMIKLKTNADYFGRPLVDPNVKTAAALQLAQNLGVGHLPIGAQAVINTMMGKQTKLQGAIAVGGLGTHVSPQDPIMIKYAGIDHAIELIKDIAPNDPDRQVKMQEIFNSLPPDQRKSLAFQEMMSGVSTKGIYQSEVERKYFEVQDLIKNGDIAGATAITKALSKQDYQTYKSIKTRLAHVATFQKVKDLVANGDTAGAAALTGAMTKQEYASYQTWKKNNP